MDQIGQTAWCQQLLRQPNTVQRHVVSRIYPGPGGPNENAFFAKTMAQGVRAVIALIKNAHLPPLERECLCIVALGSELDSHSGVLHGGACATLCDEAFGLAAGEIFSRDSSVSYYTVDLAVSFKKPVMTPTILLVRAHVASHKGRKMRVEGKIEDGKGNVYCTAKALYISAEASGRLSSKL